MIAATVRIAASAILIAALAGCEQVILEGRATDARGEDLPGVVVRLHGTSRQDLTDGLGRYRLTASRSARRVSLRFSKTGYAPTAVDVELRGRVVVTAPDAVLWLLPQNPGVYTLQDSKYVAADWALPKEYYLEEGGSQYGVELPETLRVELNADALWIACYRTPRYNGHISRLDAVNATVPGVGAEPVQIWVDSGTIVAGMESVDPLEGRLQRVVVDRPLQPGVYAVHWGAIEGYTTLDARAYVFRVVEPPEPEESPDESSGEDDAEPSDTPTDAAPDLIEPPEEAAPAPTEP